jgi:hypothetical protein
VVAIAALREPKGHVSAVRSAHGSASSVAKQTATQPTTKKTPPARRSSSTTASGTAGLKSVPLVVLNNTTVRGLAAQAAHRFEAGGWTVTESGNLANDIISTCAYYDPSHPRAKAAADALQAQYPTIKRVEPKFPQLPNGPVVVVLTPDYSAS